MPTYYVDCDLKNTSPGNKKLQRNEFLTNFAEDFSFINVLLTNYCKT